MVRDLLTTHKTTVMSCKTLPHSPNLNSNLKIDDRPPPVYQVREIFLCERPFLLTLLFGSQRSWKLRHDTWAKVGTTFASR